ncbi:hypothetical protein [Vibrio metschnikovii]|uniref:hypothetical protein n=1 Tax=Vibrio metschnikovii TaxID=28172 RepID=UPI002FC7544B
MENIKEFLEIAYYISGILLVWVAYLALGQIKVARQQLEEQKKSLKITSKRDALKLTSEQVTNYGINIIPLQSTLEVAINKHGVTFFKNSKVEINGAEIKVTPPQDEKELEKIELIVKDFTNVMNALEGFAVYFASGVANEKLAYQSLAKTYCHHLQKYMPLLVMIDAGNKRFSASMFLFNAWHSRLVAEELAMERAKINEKIKSHKTHTISTVGET